MKSHGWRSITLREVAEAVSVCRRRWRQPLQRLGVLAHRLFLIVGYAWVGVQIELPLLTAYLPLKNVLVCLVAVLLVGKTLFDTLFFDHYRP
jgi:hypothetical protein